MERLTGRRDGRAYIVGCPDFALPKTAGLIIQQTVDRLAAYEDTGLEPEEIQSQKGLFDYLVFDSTPSEDIERFQRLRELAEADREGKIPKYTIGDTIYDRFGDAWEVTAVERRLLAGEPKWIYRLQGLRRKSWIGWKRDCGRDRA